MPEMYEVYVAILFCFILENALFWHTSVSMDGYAELTCTVLLRVGVSVFQSPSSALCTVWSTYGSTNKNKIWWPWFRSSRFSSLNSLPAELLPTASSRHRKIQKRTEEVSVSHTIVKC